MALLIQFLVAFGVAAGRRAYWPIEASRHYPNEFAVLVGPSSKGRKGSAWDHVEAILADVDPAIAGDALMSGLELGRGPHRPGQRPDRRERHRRANRQTPARHRGRVRAGNEGPRARRKHTLTGRPQRMGRKATADDQPQLAAPGHRRARRDHRSHHQGRAAALPRRDRACEWLLQPLPRHRRPTQQAAAARWAALRPRSRASPRARRHRPPRHRQRNRSVVHRRCPRAVDRRLSRAVRRATRDAWRRNSAGRGTRQLDSRSSMRFSMPATRSTSNTSKPRSRSGPTRRPAASGPSATALATPPPMTSGRSPKNAPMAISRTEVRDLFSRNKKAREIDRALSALEDAGRLTRRSDSDGRGRPAEFWIPKVA